MGASWLKSSVKDYFVSYGQGHQVKKFVLILCPHLVPKADMRSKLTFHLSSSDIVLERIPRLAISDHRATHQEEQRSGPAVPFAVSSANTQIRFEVE